jgi:hypothetical protein
VSERRAQRLLGSYNADHARDRTLWQSLNEPNPVGPRQTKSGERFSWSNQNGTLTAGDEGGDMGFTFLLCPECLDRYGALRFDPTASYSLCSIPLCSLVWPDEHPDGMVVDGYGKHQQCRYSVMRLAGARTQLWRSGSVPEDLRELWDAAHRLLPHWPGFRRLSLDRKQMESLDACLEEFLGFGQALQQDYPDATSTDEGGGLRRFTARRKAEPPPG